MIAGTPSGSGRSVGSPSAGSVILFLGDRSIPAVQMAEAFRDHGYAGDSLTHEWELASDEEMVRANRRHEIHGVEGFADAQSLAPLLAGHRDSIVGIVTHFFPISRRLLDELSALRFIGTVRNGVQNIDMAAAAARGVEVRNNPGRNASAVADFTLGLMLATSRGIAGAHRQLVEGSWLARQQARSFRTLSSQRVGLVGFGHVGQRVARLLRGFECAVSVYDPYLDMRSLDGAPGVAAVASLPELLRQCNLVSLHAPVTAATRDMIGARELKQLGADGILINTARAELVSEQALIAALAHGMIWAAGLDVFSEEPLPADHPLRGLPNVTLSPHLAGLSRDAVPQAIGLLAERLRDLLPQASPAQEITGS